MTSGTFRTNSLPRLIVAIRGMVGLQDDKGDWHTRQQIEHYFDVVTEASHECGGIVSSYEHDSAFISFSNPKKALKASFSILDKLMAEEAGKMDVDGEALDTTSKLVPLSVRLGIHYGALNVQMGEFSGPVMDVTKKMVTRAKPSQIIASQQFIDQVAGEEIETKQLGSVNDAGGKIDLIEIVTEHSGKGGEPDVSVPPSTDGVPTPNTATQTILMFQGTQIIVGESQPIVVMGRDVNNDFIVNVETASRQHARVEYDNGCFVISDHSTNGTYVQITGAQPVFLKQQQIQLQSSGVISLGQPITEHALLIQYMCQ